MPNNAEITKMKIAPGSVQRIVPDTSVIIERVLSRRIEQNELHPAVVFIHEAVLGELEHQANQNRETGFLGLEEVRRLRKLAEEKGFTLEYVGIRPAEGEIRLAKSGAIDAIIRELARIEDAVLFTADRVQALVAESRGIPVLLVKFETQQKPLRMEAYFQPDTMSVHLRENLRPFSKRGKPGSWSFTPVTETALTREDVIAISKEIVEAAGLRQDAFIEMQRPGSTIVQLGNYRIVITKPPFSDGWEITIVRPITMLRMQDYHLSEKLRHRLEAQAEGVLVAGAPGMGKSTFAQALAEHYAQQNKVVKTVEAPRDLQVSEQITQYAITHGSAEEVHDILLLTRPDYTIFDEMRNTGDFQLYADMRLSGVGMIGVVHGTTPIDAVQRFLGRIELGVIPHVVDTVIFIRNGSVAKVYGVSMEVKVPSGMTEADLARPVVAVRDFETGKLEFEIYSYGEETVVLPVSVTGQQNPVQRLACREIERAFRHFADEVDVDMASDNKACVTVPEHVIAEVIGRQGKNIEAMERSLGLSLEVKAFPAGKGKKRR